MSVTPRLLVSTLLTVGLTVLAVAVLPSPPVATAPSTPAAIELLVLGPAFIAAAVMARRWLERRQALRAGARPLRHRHL